ncbi:hypothetical protein Lumi_049 [Xylophilus phage Lumi]|nr:hypothetical protein Lumi_049 [Xylophilus phage Lumi]
MSLFKFTLNGKTHVVDAASKATVQSYATSLVDIDVQPAGAGDILGLTADDVKTILPRGQAKTAAAPAPAEGEQAAA